MKKVLFFLTMIAIALCAGPIFAEAPASVPSGAGVSSAPIIEAAPMPVISVQAKSVVLSAAIIYKIVFITMIVSTIDWAIILFLYILGSMVYKAIVAKSKDKPKEEGDLPFWKRIFGWIRWGLRQLLPLTYRSHYEQDGKKHFTVWRMWLGKCFDQEDVIEAT